MAAGRPAKLRVGVIGLGRLWEARHRPAFARMGDRFRVTAVYDQVIRRAEVEAGAVGGVAAGGVEALIGRRDVDAIYLLSPQWFGLHALKRAVAVGKPVYCALPIPAEPGDIAAFDDALRSSPAVFMPEFARRVYPATVRLRELLTTRLGPARLVIGLTRVAGFDRYGHPGPSTQIAPAPLLLDPGAYLIDWCRHVFGGEPVSVRGAGGPAGPGASVAEGHEVETFVATFADGAFAQWTVARHGRGAWGDAAKALPPPGIQVFAERGAAWLELPDRIVWTDASGVHDERLPMTRSIGESLNDHFHAVVTSGEPASPGWDDALAVARLVLRLREGRVVAGRPA